MMVVEKWVYGEEGWSRDLEQCILEEEQMVQKILEPLVFSEVLATELPSASSWIRFEK